MSSGIDNSYFEDIANDLKISDPVIVEKDYYVIELLKFISELENNDYKLVFSGGTCLSKTSVNTHRMSEDIDIKLVPTERVKKLTGNPRKKCLKELKLSVVQLLESSPIFENIGDVNISNQYKKQTYEIKYPSTFPQIMSLRPNIKLELYESPLYEQPSLKSIQSIYAQSIGDEDDSLEMLCVSAEVTACEKFISLLRRTAFSYRNDSKKEDEQLIRHVYDLHLIFENDLDLDETKPMLLKVMEADKKQFFSNHQEFINNPISELQVGLKCLIDDKKYEKRYRSFIGPLVYKSKPPSWKEALDSVSKMANIWLR